VSSTKTLTSGSHHFKQLPSAFSDQPIQIALFKEPLKLTLFRSMYICQKREQSNFSDVNVFPGRGKSRMYSVDIGLMTLCSKFCHNGLIIIVEE